LIFAISGTGLWRAVTNMLSLEIGYMCEKWKFGERWQISVKAYGLKQSI
jgi:hypothetical protein